MCFITVQTTTYSHWFELVLLGNCKDVSQKPASPQQILKKMLMLENCQMGCIFEVDKDHATFQNSIEKAKFKVKMLYTNPWHFYKVPWIFDGGLEKSKINYGPKSAYSMTIIGHITSFEKLL